MAAALRIYNGKPLINSVNGKPEVMEQIFPIAAKYGGVIIALTIDENGIPKTAEGRIKIAEKIIARAADYKISPKDIIIDPLAMAVSSDCSSALVTLECLKRLSNMGIKTSLGVSNVSFGLPQRGIINSTFFAMALTNGLNTAIMNPHTVGMMDTYYGYCALSELDDNCTEYIKYSERSQTNEIHPRQVKDRDLTPEQTLKRAVLTGLKEDASAAAKTLLKSMPSLEVINKCIIPALDEIGIKFEKKLRSFPSCL